MNATLCKNNNATTALNEARRETTQRVVNGVSPKSPAKFCC